MAKTILGFWQVHMNIQLRTNAPQVAFVIASYWQLIGYSEVSLIVSSVLITPEHSVFYNPLS